MEVATSPQSFPTLIIFLAAAEELGCKIQVLRYTSSSAALSETPGPEEKQFVVFFSLGASAASAELATVSFTRLLQNLNIFLLLLKMAPQEISIHTGRARFPCKASAWNSTAQRPNAPEQPDPLLQTSQWCLSPATFCGLLGNQCHQYHVDFENLALVHWIENRTAISPQATKQ